MDDKRMRECEEEASLVTQPTSSVNCLSVGLSCLYGFFTPNVSENNDSGSDEEDNFGLALAETFYKRDRKL